jgi:hypothetical protein
MTRSTAVPRLVAALAAVLAAGLVASPVAASAANAAHSAYGYQLLSNLNSNLCLGVAGGDMANGSKVVQSDCTDHPDQWWTWMGNGDGFYEVRNSANNSKCLGVPGGSKDPGAQLVIWDCNGHLDQQWHFSSVDYGNDAQLTFLQNRNSRLIIGVAGGSQDPGAAVVQWWLDVAGNNQAWIH